MSDGDNYFNDSNSGDFYPEFYLFSEVLKTYYQDIDLLSIYFHMDQKNFSKKFKLNSYYYRHPIPALNKMLYHLYHEHTDYLCDLIGLNVDYFRQSVLNYLSLKIPVLIYFDAFQGAAQVKTVDTPQTEDHEDLLQYVYF